MTLVPAILFDIDGTLADVGHRVHFLAPERAGGKDWDLFYDAMVNDTPLEYGIWLARSLCRPENLYAPEILFVTARRNTHRVQTVKWLFQCLTDVRPLSWYDERLFMRGKTDRRPDFQVKQSILQRVRNVGYAPILAVEDSETVAKMYKAEGVCSLLV